MQINVSDIHIRYEDSHTNHIPFSCGVTLKSLNFETTDENYEPHYDSDDSARLFYKLVGLDSFAVYWHPDPKEMFQKFSTEELPVGGEIRFILFIHPLPQAKFYSRIESYEENCQHSGYILEPLKSFAHAAVNRSPDRDNYSIPRAFLELTLEQLMLCLSRRQFQGIMEFVEGLQDTRLKTIYMKYKELTPINLNDAQRRWRFAYNCILGEVVRPHRKEWSWANIKEHRFTMRKYKRLYKKKLVQDKMDGELTASEEFELTECERVLNVSTILLVRHMAEREAGAKIEQLQEKKKEKERDQSWLGWITGRSVKVNFGFWLGFFMGNDGLDYGKVVRSSRVESLGKFTKRLVHKVDVLSMF